jgi:RimK family alpha-L-glutamate ligase
MVYDSELWPDRWARVRLLARPRQGGRIAVVTETVSETNQDIVDSWRGLGLDAVVASPAESLDLLRPGDTALGRLDVRRSLDGVEAGLLELLELRRRGIRVLNRPAALLRAHDKLRTARMLAAARVNHPRTAHVTCADPLPSVRPPVVVKPRFGSWGADVVRCDSVAALREAIDAIRDRPWFRRQGAIVQRLIPPVGHDLRVLVAGGRVVGAESRIAAPDEWRTNISLGGSSCPAIIPPHARAAALAAARALSADFVGIDLLPHRGEYVVIEVNGGVDFERRYSLPGRDVFTDIATALGLLHGSRREHARPGLAAAAGSD